MDKLQKIRAEVERLRQKVINGATSGQYSSETIREKNQLLVSLISFIDSMQEESIYTDFTKALAECIHQAQGNVVDPLVLAETWKDELIKLAKSEEPVSEKDYKCPKCGGHMTLDMSAKTASVKPMYYLRCDKCRYLDFIECDKVRKEEPVSGDMEEAARKYFKSLKDDSFISSDIMLAFKAGAKWQKEQMMKDAVEVKVKVDAGGYPYVDRVIELYDYEKDIPLAKKGDKYKVILIKED